LNRNVTVPNNRNEKKKKQYLSSMR